MSSKNSITPFDRYTSYAEAREDMDDWCDLIGKGVSGRAYLANIYSGWIVRISERWGSYEEYVTHVQEMQCRLTPEIRYIKRFDGGGSLVILERLATDRLRHPTELRRAFRSLWRSRCQKSSYNERALRHLDTRNVKLTDIELLFDVIEEVLATDRAGKFDVSGQNVGFRRGTDELVVFDPVS